MKKPVSGVLSGMGFLLARTTRTRQRWRDGEGALGSCLPNRVQYFPLISVQFFPLFRFSENDFCAA